MWTGFVLRIQLVGMVQLIYIPQVKILGNIFQFNWQDPSKVSVTWAISGVGNYTLQTAAGYPTENPPPNTAMDIYLGEWVPILVLHLKSYSTLRDKIPARQTRYFRMIQPTSRRPRGVVISCRENFNTLESNDSDTAPLLQCPQFIYLQYATYHRTRCSVLRPR